MRGLVAVIRYEVLLQLRTGRFRLAAIGYVAICALPPVVLLLVFRAQSEEALGATSYLAQTLVAQPLFTAILAGLVAGNRSSVQAQEEAWPVFAAAPMSNTGYLARRWIALLTLILPLSLIPQIVTFAISFATGIRVFEPSTWIGTWFLWVLPPALMISAYWLGLVMVCSGEIGALMVTLLGLPIVRESTNYGLLHLRLKLGSLGEWLSFGDFIHWFRMTSFGLGEGRSRFFPGYAATEAPYDLTQGFEWLLARAVLDGGFCLFMLCLAVAFVRRTRRDLSPRPVPPDHQLRTFLQMLNRQRQRYAPDGGLGRRERLTLALGVIVFGASLTFALGLQRHFQNLASLRYQAETKDTYDPLPLDIATVAWTVRGHLEPNGSVRSEVHGRMENRGTQPREQLVFSLNPGLQIQHFAATSHTVTTERSWDRLRVTLDPPLQVATGVDLEIHLAGTPKIIDFFPRRGDYPFVMRYEWQQTTRLTNDFSDMARTPVHRVVTPRRIDLQTTDISPIPRYTPWTLTGPPEVAGGFESDGGDFGREVPHETLGREVDFEIEIDAPLHQYLADTCGHVGEAMDGRTRLRGTCRTTLTDFRVLGGPIKASADASPGPAAGGVIFAALPAHREQAEVYRQSLALVASLTDRAWPGMKGLEGLVAIEQPPSPNINLRHDMRTWNEEKAELYGQLLAIPERLLISLEPPNPEALVAQLLSRDLRARRRVAKDQEMIFETLFSALMLRRMGLAKRGATVSGKPWLMAVLELPILQASPFHRSIWRLRLPAVLVDIESRVGSDNLYAAIESFLASSSAEPGTIEELLADLESRANVSLARIYEDHFQGKALPLLRLVDVTSDRRDDGWVVEGKLRNTGTGESLCPVVIKTEVAESILRVRVDSESETPFSMLVATRPHTVLLDPELTCYRWQNPNSSALERINVLQ